MIEPSQDLRQAAGWLWSDFFDRKRRLQSIGVFVLMIAGGLAELVTLGAVFPLLTMLAGPQASKHSRISELLAWLGLDLTRAPLGMVALFFVVVAVVTAAVRILVAWANQRLVFRVGYDLGVALYDRMLHQTYSFHVQMNSSRIIAEVGNIQQLLSKFMLPLLQALSAAIVALFIVGGLMLIDASVALVAIVGFGGMYVAVSAWSRPRLRRNGIAIREGSRARVQAVQEGLGGIRDVLLDNSQSMHIRKFAKIDTKLRDAQAANALIGIAPRFIVEALGLVLISGITLWLASRGSILQSLPILAALALGAQRLLPLLQTMYNGFTEVMGNHALLLSVVDLLQRPLPERFEAGNSSTERMVLKDEIRAQNVEFRYSPDRPPAVRNLNFVIKRGARVGFIGKSGSGKSTLADLLMGFLRPTDGAILIDGVALDERNILAWQQQIAHVSQHVFLSDASVLENVAFGVAPKKIDRDRVRAACRLAEIDDFIAGLEDGYDTFIGERGVRFSGGQRQRIGLARALYKEASLLVLDEATSALDDATEASIIDSVHRLGQQYTVLMIAHRLTTLRDCDVVFRLENGRVVEQGTYEHVIGRKKLRSPV